MANGKLAPIKFKKNIMIGCDPEFFFADATSGKVVGSEKVLTAAQKASGLVIDGVQAELNPAASYCRQILASNISNCFKVLRTSLAASGRNVVVKTDAVVDISRAELDSLSENCQVFGCAPSTNIYSEGENKTSKISVDPKKYLKRSAGGHIHMGNAWTNYLEHYNEGTLNNLRKQLKDLPKGYDYDWQRTDIQRQITAHEQAMKNHEDLRTTAKNIDRALKKMPDTMVAVLDIVVGNTCVLVDISEGNKERRANYGRAGEYRLKEYGIEYRPLSNFWLRSYQLMSFVTGLCRFAVHIVAESTPENDYVKALFDAVSREDIVKAINTNDRALALQNFKKVQQLFKDWADENTGHDFYPIRESTLKYFYHFILRIKQKGLEYWFPTDAMTHWCGQYSAGGGWETFVTNQVSNDLANFTREVKRNAKNLAAA